MGTNASYASLARELNALFYSTAAPTRTASEFEIARIHFRVSFSYRLRTAQRMARKKKAEVHPRGGSTLQRRLEAKHPQSPYSASRLEASDYPHQNTISHHIAMCTSKTDQNFFLLKQRYFSSLFLFFVLGGGCHCRHRRNPSKPLASLKSKFSYATR